jgi:type IV pilus assembly protein PilB
MSGVANPGFVKLAIDRRLVGAAESRRLIGEGKDAIPLLRHVIAAGRCPAPEAKMLWAEGFGRTWIDLATTLVDHAVLRRLPQALAENKGIVLLYRLGESITAAVANPADESMLAMVAGMAGAPLSVVVALPDDIAETIQLNYPASEDIESLQAETPLLETDIAQAAQSEQVVRLVDTLLSLAVREGASDVHFEPRETFTRVRFRVDGELRDRFNLDSEVHARVASRLKVLADMDITEKRRPQDGRLVVTLPTRKLEFRLSTVPSLHGEKIALRSLTRRGLREVPKLDEIGLAADNLARIKRAVSGRSGLVLAVGPTGSGKTTTLFAALNMLDGTRLNILTVEEPVEYMLPRATQVAVNRAVDLGFAEVLRSFMRQDPDVILVGEIRDRETLGIALEAALTGHLVFASLHANTTLQALTRLRQLGATDELISSCVLAILSQRLVPAICPDCRASYQPEREVLDRLFTFEGDPEVPFFRGGGCERCKNTGYRGRVGIHEVLPVEGELQELLAEGAGISALTEAAHRAGFTPLRYDGLKKVLRGLTTIEALDEEVAD